MRSHEARIVRLEARKDLDADATIQREIAAMTDEEMETAMEQQRPFILAWSAAQAEDPACPPDLAEMLRRDPGLHEWPTLTAAMRWAGME